MVLFLNGNNFDGQTPILITFSVSYWVVFFTIVTRTVDNIMHRGIGERWLKKIGKYRVRVRDDEPLGKVQQWLAENNIKYEYDMDFSRDNKYVAIYVKEKKDALHLKLVWG